jgi:hypothetical protein
MYQSGEIREILFHARLHLIQHDRAHVFTTGDYDAVQLLAGIEMGMAYNVSAPGRGI